jgi:hypothetical protein
LERKWSSRGKGFEGNFPIQLRFMASGRGEIEICGVEKLGKMNSFGEKNITRDK